MTILPTKISLFEITGCKIVGFLKLQWMIFLLLVFIPDSTIAKSFNFSDWGILLKKYIDSSTIDGIRLNTVNYRMLQSDPIFSQLVSDLESFLPSELQTHEEKLAFWINVYNVFAVKIVTDNYPLKSIKDIGGLFKSVWKHKAGVIGGKEYTLDEIEHEILRKMEEPRVHFAIVCASVSCPDLAKEVFGPERLNEQLNIQTKVFLTNPGKGMKVDAASKKIFLSSIFDWFKEDFGSRGGVLEFIHPYAATKDRQVLKHSSLRIFYIKYNWRLNGS